jgi:GTP-binding protein
VAPYPFTTLAPHLGVVRHGDEDRFVMADIPGLIEGAHHGAGLGIRFLRHLSRTSFLVHLIEPSGSGGHDPERNFDTVNAELARYDRALGTKPQVVVATKTDLAENRERLPALRAAFAARGIVVYSVSAITREGVEELVSLLCTMVAQRRRESAVAVPEADRPGGSPGLHDAGRSEGSNQRAPFALGTTRR